MPIIDLTAKRLEYRFEIKNKYTIIKGDSASGKTSFYNMVSASQSKKGVQNRSSHKLVAVPADFDSFNIKNYTNAVLVVDENCTLFKKKNRDSIINKSKNYFIFLTRTINIGLPISVDAIYKFKNSGKFHSLLPFYSLSNIDDINNITNINSIISEDLKSGFKFIKEMLSAFDINNTIDISSAKGKDKICSHIENKIQEQYYSFAIIYDSSAFGLEKEKLDTLIKRYKTIDSNKYHFYIFDWVSFEHYILSTPVYNVLLTPEDCGCNYISLERFAESEIKKYIPNYNKDSLSKCLRRTRCDEHCIKKSECDKMKYSYKALIHSKLAILYIFFDKLYAENRLKVDFPYSAFYKYNKKQLNNKDLVRYRISKKDYEKGVCYIEQIKDVMSIIKIIQGVCSNKFVLTNASELKEWGGWTN